MKPTLQAHFNRASLWPGKFYSPVCPNRLSQSVGGSREFARHLLCNCLFAVEP